MEMHKKFSMNRFQLVVIFSEDSYKALKLHRKCNGVWWSIAVNRLANVFGFSFNSFTFSKKLLVKTFYKENFFNEISMFLRASKSIKLDGFQIESFNLFKIWSSNLSKELKKIALCHRLLTDRPVRVFLTSSVRFEEWVNREFQLFMPTCSTCSVLNFRTSDSFSPNFEF